jgi:RNA polymerase sigma factor for flagellar operon FliA
MTLAEVAYKQSSQEVDDRDAMVMQELSQVYYIATRIRERLPQQVELEDLVNAGVIGLMEASRSFNSAKNTQFKQFAKFRIRGAIMDSLRESDWGSRSLRRKGREIAEAVARLEAKLGRHPIESEIAEELQLDPAYLQSIIAQLDGLYLAGQQAAVSNDQTDLLDVIESAPNLTDPDPFDLCLEGETKAHLQEAISKLSEREQLILSLYYREELTMKEISEVVGVALSRVSQIRQATMKKLRESLAHLHERPSNPNPSSGGYVEHAQSSRRQAGPSLATGRTAESRQ